MPWTLEVELTWRLTTNASAEDKPDYPEAVSHASGAQRMVLGGAFASADWWSVVSSDCSGAIASHNVQTLLGLGPPH